MSLLRGVVTGFPTEPCYRRGGRGVAGEGAWQGYVAAHAEEREGQARANDES